MKILIAAPLLPSQPGGPGMYAALLGEEFRRRGFVVSLCAFGDVRTYPPGIRHLVYLLRAYQAMRDVDAVLVLDTWSVALPALVATWLRRRKSIIRIGGDYLWEHYVARTGNRVPLSEFYTTHPGLSIKERVIYAMTKRYILPRAHRIVFSTTWQQDIWREPYRLERLPVSVIENAYAYQKSSTTDTTHTHDAPRVVWVGRTHPLKNVEILDRVVAQITKDVPDLVYEKYTNVPHEDVLRNITQARALIIPSVSEVSPNLAFEALARGTPVILTRDCGIYHVLRDVVTWVDVHDDASIDHAIRAHLDRHTYAAIQARARAFTPTRSYTQVADDFSTLIARAL